MTDAPAHPTFWDDLTGRSDRWGRTLVYAVVLGRLSLMGLGALLLAIYGQAAIGDFSGLVRSIEPGMILLIVGVAPPLESLIVLLIVWLVGGLLRAPAAVVAFACGAAFVPLHGLTPLSLMVLPFFALMGLIQLNWMRRRRAWRGFLLVTAVHAVANAVAVAAALGLGPAGGP